MNPLYFVLDLRSGVPIYVQIVEQVQQLVASGKLKPGDQLPTVRQLASELRVNFNTVARAYRMLDEAGIISTQQGRGTYILDAAAAGLGDWLERETLEVQVNRFLVDLLQQGFSLPQIRETLEKKLKEVK
ncbi:MAG: GntR family transcriptional regulator [Anaerolineaceae bacterium]|nr:GntR family transcriptional regulator [Anaerolineaceae bacterium]